MTQIGFWIIIADSTIGETAVIIPYLYLFSDKFNVFPIAAKAGSSIYSFLRYKERSYAWID